MSRRHDVAARCLEFEAALVEHLPADQRANAILAFHEVLGLVRGEVLAEVKETLAAVSSALDKINSMLKEGLKNGN
jgi:hypothetical protein